MYVMLFVAVMVALSLVALLTFRFGGQVNSLTLRVEELEKKPVATLVRETTPEAGPSGQPQVIVTPVPTPVAAASTVPPSASATPNAKVRQTTFLPIVASGTTTQNNWVEVVGSDFSVNLSVEYGSGAYVTWDANLSIESGSGEAAARLFDVTDSVAVPGSEITTTSAQSKVITSSRLSMLNGQNTYRVQIKSKTSTTASFFGGRVKFVH
jgi:hypothetical protein